jgi:biotin carboxyl carrier protein
MEHQICASIDGIVDAVSVGKGQQVAARDILITIQPSAA